MVRMMVVTMCVSVLVTMRMDVVVTVMMARLIILVPMNVRMVSSAVTMIVGAQISTLCVVAIIDAREITFPPLGQCGVQVGTAPKR
jgi:hypothetical protein